MTLSTRQLALATLDRQLLLERARLDVAEAVRRICAVQAQSPASPYLALWNRVQDFTPEDLDAAFTRRRIVKATLMRITLHAVHAEDYAPFHAAMTRSLRASRLYDRRFTATGLAAEDVDAVLPDIAVLLQRPHTGAELETELTDRFGEHARRVWWALRTFAPVQHVPAGGPWSYTLPNVYRASPTARGGAVTEDAGVQFLLLSYLRAFGPASAQDFARFTLLTSPIVKSALAGLGDRVVRVPGPGRAALYDLPGAPVPDEDVPVPPRLLAMWDSTLLAHVGGGRLVPQEYRSLIVRRNGDVLPCVLVDGQVAGVWRAVEGGLEVTSFHKLGKAAWRGLADEAASLLTMLAAREPEVYRRYRHWWDKGLPGAETVLLKG
ncbi:DNA glycosylase AlkZ-like family protein [Streptomyces sp. NPDC008150]|uniref:winged helix DNA-binding domain-containing protein n=1 Tax=Streptomyces sp. NPDC008150 TaxID=3364816 RepID=UPI0036EB6575